MVEELQTVVGELQEVIDRGGKDCIYSTYDTAARLVSCNRKTV